MKIFELITPQEIQPQMKKPHDIEASREKAMYGSSAYGQGKPISKRGIDDAEYSKTNYFPSELQDDAYYAYIQAVKPLMGGNPYVPEIYKIVKIRDTNGQIIPRYEMRAYEPWRNFKKPELVSILAKISPVEVESMDPEYTLNDIWYIITGLVHNAARTDKETEDPDLNQVLEIIRNVVASNPAFDYDMHGSNFLIRRTPYGPQLVITDPVQDGGFSTTKSSGKSTWGSKRDSRDLKIASKQLFDDLKGLVSDSVLANKMATPEDVNKLIRRTAVVHKFTIDELVKSFGDLYHMTPQAYFQDQLQKST